jgi:hypothetical protein
MRALVLPPSFFAVAIQLLARLQKVLVFLIGFSIGWVFRTVGSFGTYSAVQVRLNT